MKRLYGIAIVAIPISTVVLVTYLFSVFYVPPVPALGAVLENRTVAVGSAAVNAELALTKSQQARGLGDRIGLGSDEGMLFLFSPPTRPGFWMKGMRFPLDLIYVADGRVAELKENVPPTLAPAPFFPASEVDAVLEVNAGWVAKRGIKVGDAVSY